MKNFLNLLLVTFVMLPVAVFAEVITVTVKGMVCSFCAHGINKSFRKNKAVQNITVDLDTKLVTIEVKDGQALTDKEVEQTVNDAGYDVLKLERKKNA